LKSVAIATAAPASISARTSGGVERRKSVDVGSRTATVAGAAPSAEIPAADTWFRWSALNASSATAASAAPEGPSWSA
jgi:hypothetical protein